MINILLFLVSCTLVVGFSRVAAKMGEGLLTAWITILCLLANFFVLKQITLFGLNTTASDVFAIGSLWSLNLMQEHYGKASAQKAIWASFLGLGFFALMANIHLAYQPSDFDQSQAAYTTLLAPSPRILIGSLIAFFIAQQCDRQFFQFLKTRFPQISPLWRSFIPLIVSQAIDTVLFSFFALYGIINKLDQMILLSFTIKCIAIIAMLPSAFLTKKVSPT